MGIVAIFGALIAGVVALVPGIIAVICHSRARKRGHGSWGTYWAIAIIAAIVCIALGAVLLIGFGDGTGAPTEEDYTRLIVSFALFGASPGIGMTLGAFALLKRAPNEP